MACACILMSRLGPIQKQLISDAWKNECLPWGLYLNGNTFTSVVIKPRVGAKWLWFLVENLSFTVNEMFTTWNVVKEHGLGYWLTWNEIKHRHSLWVKNQELAMVCGARVLHASLDKVLGMGWKWMFCLHTLLTNNNVLNRCMIWKQCLELVMLSPMYLEGILFLPELSVLCVLAICLTITWLHIVGFYNNLEHLVT